MKLVPHATITALHKGRTLAIRNTLTWVTLLELVKLPMYSRSTSATDILLGAITTFVAVYGAPLVTKLLKIVDRSWIWASLAISWTMLMLLVFLSRFSRVVSEPEQISSRLWGIFAVPFARAQRSSEFEAVENIVLKILVFATLAFLITGWLDRRYVKWNIWHTGTLIAWGGLIGVMIEVGQVFLFPLVPDVTDLVIYSIGLMIGPLVFRFLVPRSAGYKL